MAMSKGKKILIVDDELDILTYFEALFEDSGYDTVGAVNGIEGFELAKSEKPDLITLDITMPTQSGLKVYRQYKKHPALKNIPIIIITAVDDFIGAYFDEHKDLGPPEGIFYKPFDPRKIMKLIAKILSG
jgi:CheY-like chemotaxis protein